LPHTAVTIKMSLWVISLCLNPQRLRKSRIRKVFEVFEVFVWRGTPRGPAGWRRLQVHSHTSDTWVTNVSHSHRNQVSGEHAAHSTRRKLQALVATHLNTWNPFWKSMPQVLKLHYLSWPPGGDISGCIEVYASCVEAALSLLTTRGRLLWLYRSLTANKDVKEVYYFKLTSFITSRTCGCSRISLVTEPRHFKCVSTQCIVGWHYLFS